MRKGKKINVNCFGPIAVSKKYSSPWEDVWLSWTGKPGRKKYRLAPCLCGKLEAEQELELTLECKEKYPEIDWDEDIQKSELALMEISNGNIYVEDPKDKITNIYTPKDCIDREEAEKMIRILMESHGFDLIRLKWNRPKLIVIPM